MQQQVTGMTDEQIFNMVSKYSQELQNTFWKYIYQWYSSQYALLQVFAQTAVNATCNYRQRMEVKGYKHDWLAPSDALCIVLWWRGS